MNRVAGAVAAGLLLSGSPQVAAQTGTRVYVQYEGFIKEADDRRFCRSAISIRATRTWR